ncbi:hypothetical protein [Campylobacter jejuni]
MPLTEVMEVWQGNDKEVDYNYIRNLCQSMAKKLILKTLNYLMKKQ